MAEKTKPAESGLFKKLVEIMGDVGRIEKRGYNKFHGYSYVTESDLTEVLRDKLAAKGVLIIPSLESVQHDDTLTTATMTFTLIDSETGERERVPWAGCGDDKGDKGLYKAYTGSLKYFLMKLFLVSQGDDPEADTSTDRRAESTSGACPQCGKVKSVIKGKPEYGGGWLCFKKKGGCGATWPDDNEAAEAPQSAPPASLDDTAMNALREQIKAAMQALNEAGDTPEWTVQRVNEMSKEHFGAVAAKLNLENLGQLAEMFSQRLESIRKDSAQGPNEAELNRKATLATIQAKYSKEAIGQALKGAYPDRDIESLSVDELLHLEEEIIPF